MPLVTLEHISHAYGHVPLLDDVALQIDTGERIAIIGRNGTGKSTLIQIIAGDLPPDRGSVWRQPGTRVARLVQDVPLSANRTVAEVVGEGLGTLDPHDEWQRSHQADMVMSRLQLQPDVIVDTLSGGTFVEGYAKEMSLASNTILPVVRDFSIRIMRGDRIGLIGPNGSGKTTFLKLLLGELEPATGSIRRGANVDVAYYDQQREQLDPDRSVIETIGDGTDTVTVNGRPRHVHGYLQDFLFSPERARSPVRALSGGERNRLLLARLFTRPANVLVLDEPTNDLDLETLELLEQQLVEWPGTLLLVSHDRRFLDNVVTSTVAFEGGGGLQEYVGGYEDWLRQRTLPGEAKDSSGRAKGVSGKATGPSGSQPKTKRTFKEDREYAALPDRIAALEAEQRQLHAAIADPDFYQKPAAEIHAALERVTAIEGELLAALERWDALDSIGH